MSRLKPQIENENIKRELTLDELIPQYALNKTELDSYKKLCDRDNAKIKSIMLEADEKEHTAGDYVAKVTVSERESMNEEMLLEIAHTSGIPEIVKTKEYIDFDALEDAIYNGRIPQEVLLEMNKAREVKEVVTLKVSKKKKEEK